MLKVTGLIGKKQYNEENVPVDTLIVELGMEQKFKEYKKTVFIDAGPNFQDKKGGQTRVAEQISIQTEVDIQHKGAQVKIRYYTSIVNRPQPGGGTSPSHLPHKLFITGGVKGFDRDEEKEVLFFLSIHPRNNKSLFYKDGVEALISTREDEVLSKNKAKFFELEDNFMDMIRKSPSEEIRLRAEGAMLGSCTEMKDDEVRVFVRNAYESQKTNSIMQGSIDKGESAARSFIAKFMSSISTMKGNIKSAKEKGIIYGYFVQGSAKYGYKWLNVNDEQFRDKMLLEVPQGGDPEDYLVRYFNTNDKAAELLLKFLSEHKAQQADSKTK